MIKFINNSANLYLLYREICDPLYLNGPITESNKVSTSGFLLGGPISQADFDKAIFAEICLNDNVPVGVIRIDQVSKTFVGDFSLNWVVEKGIRFQAQTVFESNNLDSAELGVIAIHLTHKGKGIGKRLLADAEKDLKSKGIKHLFSWVGTYPLNVTSLSFHKKNGFVIVAEYANSDEYGFTPYACTLFYKEIK